MSECFSSSRREILKSAALVATAIPALASAMPSEAKALADNTIQKAYIDGPDGQVHYWVAGQGPNLFLVHQSNKSGEEYLGLVPFLSKKYRLIVMDLPGHGYSDDPSGSHDVENLTAAAIALIDDLALDQFHILGHHGGALVAMNVAAKMPDRVMKTILSGSSGPKTAEEAKQFKTDILARDTPLDWEGTSIAGTWNRYASLRSDDANIKDLMRVYLENIKTGLRPYNVYEAFLTWDRNPALKSLKGQVLLIQGEKDIYVSHQERLLDILPNSSQVTLPGCGPYMFYERPQDCAEVIQGFLG